MTSKSSEGANLKSYGKVMQDHIASFFHNIGWDSVYEYQIQEKQHLEQNIEAFVEMDSWKINVNYSPQLFGEFSQMLQTYNISPLLEHNLLLNSSTSITTLTSTSHLDPLQTLQRSYNWKYHTEFHEMISDILFHEVGHSQECPIDNTRFAEITHAVAAALRKKEKRGLKNIAYVTNQFTDIIVNTVNALEPTNKFVRNGFFLFYFLGLMNQAKFDIPFGLFLLVNTKLYLQSHPLIDLLENKIIGQLMKDYDIPLGKLIRVFCPYEEILEKLQNTTPLSEDERWKVINYLSISQSWSEMAYDYGLIIADFLMKEEETPVWNIPHSSFTRNIIHDQRFRKEIFETIIDTQFNKNESDQKQKQNNGKETQQTNSGDHFIQHSNNLPFPEFADTSIGQMFLSDIDYLDCLYRQRLQRIEINNIQIKLNNQRPNIWLNRSILTEKDNLLNFDPLSVYFLPKSNDLLLYKKSTPLNSISDGSQKLRSFPHLAIIYDDSGSMDWNIENGNGKYDYLIIMIYSIWNWLATQSFSTIIEYNLTAFSSTTRTTGWVDIFHFERLLKRLFSKESGGTYLDPNLFEEIITHPQHKAVLLISDGEISRSKEIIQLLQKYRTEISFLMIQIGEDSRFAKNIRNLGFNVQVIEKASDLRDFALNFMKKTYTLD